MAKDLESFGPSTVLLQFAIAIGHLMDGSSSKALEVFLEPGTVKQQKAKTCQESFKSLLGVMLATRSKGHRY